MSPFCVVIINPNGAQGQVTTLVKMNVQAVDGTAALQSVIDSAGIRVVSGMQGFAFRLDIASTVKKKVTAGYADLTDLAEILQP